MTSFSIFDFGFSIGTSKRKKIPLLALCALRFALCVPAEAQQPTKIARIGVLSPFPAKTASLASFEAFRQALRELGYIEGQTIVIEYRHADGKTDRLPTLAAELVRKSTLSLRLGAQHQPLLPRRQPRRSLSSSGPWGIRSAPVLSPALPGQVETLQACPLSLLI